MTYDLTYEFNQGRFNISIQVRQEYINKNVTPLYLVLHFRNNKSLFVQYYRIFVRLRSGSDIAWWTG